MKRVLLLVLLIVSLAELAIERDRLYVFLSSAALAGLVRTSLSNRRSSQNAAKVAFTRNDALSKAASASFSAKQVYTSTPHLSEAYYEKAEFDRHTAHLLSGGK